MQEEELNIVHKLLQLTHAYKNRSTYDDYGTLYLVFAFPSLKYSKNTNLDQYIFWRRLKGMCKFQRNPFANIQFLVIMIKDVLCISECNCYSHIRVTMVFEQTSIWLFDINFRLQCAVILRFEHLFYYFLCNKIILTANLEKWSQIFLL